MTFDVTDRGDDLTLQFLAHCCDDMANIKDENDPRRWSNITGIVVTKSQKAMMMTDSYRDKPLIVKD